MGTPFSPLLWLAQCVESVWASFQGYRADSHDDSIVPQGCRPWDLNGPCGGLSATWMCGGWFRWLAEYVDQKGGVPLWSQNSTLSHPKDGSDVTMTNILLSKCTSSRSAHSSWFAKLNMSLLFLNTRGEPALERYRNYLFPIMPR